MRPTDVLKLAFGRKKGELMQVGDPAPAFSVADHTGATRTLSGYRGRTVVLWFYPKADTPG